jgi:hypothetical protein
MPDPVIVPPTPEIKQGADLSDEAAARSIQAAFDRKLPPSKNEQPPPESPRPPAEPPVKPPDQPQPEPKEEPTPPVAHKVPSFIEEALKVEPGVATDAPKPAPAEPEWPEEVPEFKTPEERKARYKAWRETYQKLKDENTRLASRPGQPDQAVTERLQFLETQNKEMTAALNRVSVENHAEFQEQVLRPMHGAWNEACRIVQEGGGDPAQLGRALSLRGKEQFEALDEILVEMPESARIEAQDAIRTFKRFDEVRRQALANAPETAKALRKADIQRQYATLEKQREEMRGYFDDAVKILRDDAKVELLLTSTDPDAKEWNEQAEAIVNGGKKLYLENSDLRKMAMACVLAPMADRYRTLWMAERAARVKAESTIKERFGAEPSLSESGGAGRTPDSVLAADLKRPFADVFIEKFHQLRSQGR